MTFRLPPALAAGILFAAAPALAATTLTLDFESTPLQVLAAGESLGFGEYTLRALLDGGAVVDDSDLSCAIAQCPAGASGNFYLGLNDSRLSITRAGGAAFGLLGFDAGFLAAVGDGPGFVAPGQIRLQATFTDGGVSNYGFDLPESDADGIFSFGSFTGNASLASGQLTALQIFACTWVGDDCLASNRNLSQFALDNVVLSPIPEPTAALLMALGLAGLAGRAARGRRAAATV